MDAAERLQTRAAIDVELGADRTLCVHIGGAWEFGDGRPSTRLVEQALAAPDPQRAVTFETAGGQNGVVPDGIGPLLHQAYWKMTSLVS